MESYDIKLFSMGGTIDKSFYNTQTSSYIVSTPQAERILGNANLSLEISIESLVQKDSLDLNTEDRELLLRRIENEQCSRIIITHGTDTLRETAHFLKNVLHKTIVFTGAMLPARFVDSDAAVNLGGALIAAQTLASGLYLVMHGRVFNPLTVEKDREKSLFY